jgi:hypothetical protein
MGVSVNTGVAGVATTMATAGTEIALANSRAEFLAASRSRLD